MHSTTASNHVSFCSNSRSIRFEDSGRADTGQLLPSSLTVSPCPVRSTDLRRAALGDASRFRSRRFFSYPSRGWESQGGACTRSRFRSASTPSLGVVDNHTKPIPTLCQNEPPRFAFFEFLESLGNIEKPFLICSGRFSQLIPFSVSAIATG